MDRKPKPNLKWSRNRNVKSGHKLTTVSKGRATRKRISSMECFTLPLTAENTRMKLVSSTRPFRLSENTTPPHLPSQSAVAEIADCNCVHSFLYQCKNPMDSRTLSIHSTFELFSWERFFCCCCCCCCLLTNWNSIRLEIFLKNKK